MLKPFGYIKDHKSTKTLKQSGGDMS